MRRATDNHLGLVLAVHPTAHGFGWVVFEGPLAPVDWGAASAKQGRNARLLKRFERLLDRYEPSVVVLEVFEGREATRIDRIRKLCRAMRHLAFCRNIDTPVYSLAVVRSCFAGMGASTRYEIALAIAQRIDAFQHRLPHKRRAWMKQDPRQSVFDAAALAIAHFAVIGIG